MKRIDVEFNSCKYTFRTNDSGDNLFYGVSQNNQISCESGFQSLSKIKKAIREHLHLEYIYCDYEQLSEKMPRIKYHPIASDWKK